ncbi:mitochondrial ATP synthase g subunit-domain-containing protein [Entophlyctis helioformis]|nr:mitochondrial ATP synthase g subunit-domain-containing protein [Entophlyctis helioformis]
MSFLKRSMIPFRRFASTTSGDAAAKAKAAASSIGARLQGFASPLIYYGRVGVEFVSQVASHQRLTSFPNIGEAQQGMANFIKALQNGEWKKVTVRQSLTFAAEGAKIYGFFLVGEMVGRGSIIGYNIEGSGHGGHH